MGLYLCIKHVCMDYGVWVVVVGVGEIMVCG